MEGRELTPMSDGPDNVPGVWQEVRRRRIGKVVSAYLALAFAVVETSRLLMPWAAAPQWVGQAVLGTLVLGFPAAAVLSWTYDITPAGVVKTQDEVGAGTLGEPTTRTWLVLSVLGLLVGAFLHLRHI